MMMKILLSGFEPFGGSNLNPSEEVILRIGKQLSNLIEIHTVLIPVDHFRGPKKLIDAINTIKPDGVLCLGEASGRKAISIERLAINLLDYRIPDNAGVQIIDEPIVPGGPAAYFVTLPVRKIYMAIQDAGIPAELSLSAGSYLCNQVLYQLLHHLALTSQSIPAGFIHLPALPEQANQNPLNNASMSFDISLEAVKIALRTTVETEFLD